LLEGKATGYKGWVDGCGGDARAAATLRMMEKIEEIVEKQVSAIRNLRIDKITVWNSGSHGGKGGSSTANFVSSLIKSIPPLQDVAGMAGVELPGYVGRMKETEAPAPEKKQAEVA